ncbi:hypothetical protein [Methylobacterium nodulans]|uniref:Uncharacterized protein n=1 Tax=Methylobacterium nodulans (strain LMG 21967 / CNCM I-2342 / ORS 2060) TaxID=460265 RepID=B8IR60_METNO|nr:hypothetical protein [Methylobacterium nodulans]ACL56762.1 conserved hypothetical protein [Methylobacterium nodulans ORS 2060]
MMGVARLVLVGAMLVAGIVVMATGPGPKVPAVSAAPAPADPCAGAAWPYRPAGCVEGVGRPAVRVIGASTRIQVAER